MSKHTPGPWKVVSVPFSDSGIAAANGAIVSEAFASLDEPRIHCSEAEANGHLIAAAPEMLEALEEILEAHTGLMYVHLSDIINKAKGETP